MREEPQVTHVSTADDVRGASTDSRIHCGRCERSLNRLVDPPRRRGETEALPGGLRARLRAHASAQMWARRGLKRAAENRKMETERERERERDTGNTEAVETQGLLRLAPQINLTYVMTISFVHCSHLSSSF